MPSNKRTIRSKLLSWYQESARDLPWRHTQDPYKVWVSEIMLQQTQVQTVIPYYNRWLKRFPSLKTLAAAPLEEVLKFWAGLGYYRRVKMLHAAAKFVQSQLKGCLPETAEALMQIPGIGRYTAGAIASIAFQKKAPLVDGNVIRILTRLYEIKDNVAKNDTLKQLWAIAEDLVPLHSPGDFNQAMMELGALICLPRNPACGACPVSSECRASASGQPENFPVKTPKEKIKKLKTAALVLKNPRREVLIRRQEESARWGGLWMFPFGESPDQIAEELQIKKIPAQHSFIIKHGFTKYSIQLHVFEAAVDKKKSKSLEIRGNRWVSLKKLPSEALPSPHKKVAARLLERVHAPAHS